MLKLLILAAPISTLFLPTLLFPPSLPGFPVYTPHCACASPSCSEGGGDWESPLPSSPHPVCVPLPLAQGGLPWSPLSPSGSHPTVPSPLISYQQGERDGIPPPPHPLFPALSHACLPHLHARTVHKGAVYKGKGQGSAAVQPAPQAVGGNTVTNVAAVQHATHAMVVHVNGRAGVQRRV